MTADDELRRALEQVLDRHDPEGDGYAKFGGDALLRDVRAALAARSEPPDCGITGCPLAPGHRGEHADPPARSEPRAEGLREAAAIVNDGIRNGRTDEDIARAVLAATPRAEGLREAAENLSQAVALRVSWDELDRLNREYVRLAATPPAEGPDVERLRADVIAARDLYQPDSIQWRCYENVRHAIDTMLAATPPAEGPDVERARIVATYWRDFFMTRDDITRVGAHACAMVLTALDGEADPKQVGIDGEAAERYAALDPEQPK